jgi:type I restriction enzyme M protein
VSLLLNIFVKLYRYMKKCKRLTVSYILKLKKNKALLQIFDNTDFGYYKVTIERPKRLKAQFTTERIAELRFDKTLKEPMVWAYETFGEKVYPN